MGKTDIFDYHPSDGQLRQLDSLLAILEECQKLGIRVWVTGGYGLDALYGALTRTHGDVDLFIKKGSKGKFSQIIKKHGYRYTPQKVGEVGKAVYRNPSFSSDFRLEVGTIEQAMEFAKRVGIKIDDSSLFMPQKPLGKLGTQPIWTPTLEGLKRMIEINNRLAKKDGGKYPYRTWQKKILEALERKIGIK